MLIKLSFSPSPSLDRTRDSSVNQRDYNARRPCPASATHNAFFAPANSHASIVSWTLSHLPATPYRYTMAQLGYFQDRHHEFTLTASAKPPLLPLPSARAGKRTNGFQGANGNATNANGTKLNDDDSAYQRYTTAASPREAIPWHHRNRSDLLHQSVLKSWQAAEPSSARKQEIAQLLDTLTHTINFSTPTHENPTRDRYKVDAFGSMAWGGDTGRSGDLDLIVTVRLAVHC